MMVWNPQAVGPQAGVVALLCFPEILSGARYRYSFDRPLPGIERDAVCPAVFDHHAHAIVLLLARHSHMWLYAPYQNSDLDHTCREER